MVIYPKQKLVLITGLLLTLICGVLMSDGFVRSWITRNASPEIQSTKVLSSSDTLNSATFNKELYFKYWKLVKRKKKIYQV